MFKRFFRRKEKELKEFVEFKYNDGFVTVVIDFESVSVESKKFLELIIDDLQEESIATIKENSLIIEHKNIYKITEDIREILHFPKLFVGFFEVDMKGLVSQRDAKFIISIFDKDRRQVIPYSVYGSVLHISKQQRYILPQNIYEIFQLKDELQTEFDKYSFIEKIQKDENIKFNSLMKNDEIQTVSKVKLDIQEDEQHNLKLSAHIDGLDNDFLNSYKNVIEQKDDSLLLTKVEDGKIKRYLLDEADVKVIEAINKEPTVLKQKAGLFMANPDTHFDKLGLDENIKERLPDSYRIVGIGEPYVGYFGSVKLDETPFSEVLKSDESFCFAINKDEVNEFLEKHQESLPKIKEQLQTAIKDGKEKIEIEDKTIRKNEFNTYLDLTNKYLKGSSQKVLLIKTNDDEEIEFKQTTRKKDLKNIVIDDGEEKSNYNNFKFKPFKHQVVSLNWFIDLYENGYSGCLLADDMGLGKTFQVISFIDYLLKKNQNSKVLIVAPTVLIENWVNEFQNSILNLDMFNIKIIRGKNSVLEKLSAVITGDKEKKDVLNDIEVIKFIDENNIYITTYKTLQKYQFAFVNEVIDLKCIIYDEAQNIKNPNTLQTQASKAVSSRENVFNILMSGTPIENELRDLWCLFDVFDPTFFGSWKNFSKEYLSKKENIGSILRKKISNYMLRRMKKDVLDGLPKKSNRVLKSVFSDDEEKQYMKIVKSNQPALSKLNSLKLFSINPILLEKERLKNIDKLLKEDVLMNFTKTKKMLELLESIREKNEKVIIFVISKAMQVLLQYTLQKHFSLKDIFVINGDNNKAEAMHSKLDNFKQKDGFNIIILSPIAVGVGLTITEANHVIHLERHYNPAKENQASDRVYRIGQKRDVFIHYIISTLPNIDRKSYDEGLDKLIKDKMTLSDDTLLPIKRIKDTELSKITL